MNKHLHETDNDILVKEHVKNILDNTWDPIDQIETDKLLTDINITIDDVTDALGKAKLNKSPGIDNITNELLKNGGDGLNHSMNQLFRKLIELESTPQEWNKGIIIPIHKKGSKNNLNNYRGITLTSCVSKVFNRIISKSISSFVEDHQLLSEIQGGFRKNYRCEDHIFSLKSIAATRLAENKSTHLAFLDFSKAFDTVWRDGLLSLAWKLGIRGSMWKIISNLYTNVQSHVKFGEIETDFFDVEEGVKQGYVLSPILFCIFINELANRNQNAGVGVRTCDVQTGCLFWADDVVLIADNEVDLQKMLNIASQFSLTWKLDFNVDKSKVLIVGKRIDKTKLWKLGNLSISECDSYKYLGVHISRNLSDHTHVNEVLKKGNRLIGYIKSIIDSHDDFNRIYYGNILWKSLALPSINYACSVWTCGSKSDINKIENLQLQMARYILKAPRNTPSVALYGDLGWQPITSLQDVHRVKYFARLSNLDMHRWPKLMLYALMNLNCDVNQIRYKWLSQIIDALKKCDMDHIIHRNVPADPHWVNTFKRINKIVYNNEWNNDVKDKSSLKDYACFKNDVQMEEYLLDKTDFYGSSLKFKARSNTLPLEHRTRNWSLNNNAKCMLCNDDSVGDLRHFLFLCKSMNGIRIDEYFKLESNLCSNGFSDIWVKYITSNLDTKLYMMLGCPINIITTPFRTSDDNRDACIILDTFCKSYLKRAWTARSKMINSK
jgi:hypothetical protein